MEISPATNERQADSEKKFTKNPPPPPKKMKHRTSISKMEGTAHSY
jgi:hypothetical protein